MPPRYGQPPSVESSRPLPSTIQVKTANYTALVADLVLADATGGAFTVTLPAGAELGDLVIVKKTDATANAVAVAGEIDGDAGGASIAAEGFGHLYESDGADAWLIVAVIGMTADATPALEAHIADTVAAHAASAISFVPHGSIAATNAQAAIQEVRDEAQAAIDALALRAAPFASWKPTGALHETLPGRVGASGSSVPPNQVLILIALPEPLRAGVPLTSITFYSGGTPLVGGAHQYFVLVRRSDRAVLRATVDDTSAAWAADTPKTLALSSGLIPGTDTDAYVGVCIEATTRPSLRGAVESTVIAGVAPALLGTSSFQPTPPADGAIMSAPAASGLRYYAVVS